MSKFIKKIFYYFKLIFLPNPAPYKQAWRNVKSVFRSEQRDPLIRIFIYFVKFIGKCLACIFQVLKYVLLIAVIIFIPIYLVANLVMMNDYFKKNYDWYQELYCRVDAQEKLKKSVVRIVGGSAEGSGFFINDQEVLTNFHVIDGEPSPKIIFSDGEFITPVKITGDSEADLAILYTEKNYPEYVFPLPDTISFDDNMPLLAAGYPMGTIINGSPTVIEGKFLDYRRSRKEKVGFVQTDFSLVEGMSGGPLVDMCGNVFGINTISMSGQALFIAASVAKDLIYSFTDQEITKIQVDPSISPEEAVKGFYTYLKARRMKEGYNLLSEGYKKYATIEEWTNRFNDIIDVDVISVSQYKKSEDAVYIKFSTKNWVDGEVEYHYYQGTWQTVKEGGNYRLSRSNIEEVKNPDIAWFYE